MYKYAFFAVVFLLFFSLSGEEKNLLKNGDFSRYKVNWVTNGEVKEEGKSGVLILSGKANRAFSRQVIDVSPADTVRITADVSADKPVNVLIGIVPVDKDWKDIFFRNTGVVKDTFTSLAEPIRKNTAQAVLARNIQVRKGLYLALDAKEDLSDLPNYKLERIAAVTQSNGKTVLKLSKTVKRTIPAGTKVRIHKDGPTYLYTSQLRKGFPGTVKADGRAGKNTKVLFRPGTAGFKVCLLILPGKKERDVKVSFRNIKVTRIPAK